MNCSVQLGDTPLDGTHPGTVLAGDDVDAHNSVESPRRVAPEKESITFGRGVTSLPPHSITFCEVSSHTVPRAHVGDWAVGAQGNWRRSG
jgi:alpha-N-arabinofuranosidase